MAEGANVEVAHHLAEHGAGHDGRDGHHWSHRVLGVVEVVLLAVVAIATAWSGFQAAKWDGRQTELYGEATAARFQAEELDSLALTELTSDASLLTAWLEARDAGDAELQTLLEKRMSPEYNRSFVAWLETDPFVNADAPAGPAVMPGYENRFRAQASSINDEAKAAFDTGTEARERGEKYVRNTVLLATVLFVAAIAQRFTDPLLRGILNGVGLALLIFAVVSLASLPRA
jgi:hypothetical protein